MDSREQSTTDAPWPPDGHTLGWARQRLVQLRHQSFNTTAGYIREGWLFKGSSALFALR